MENKFKSIYRKIIKLVISIPIITLESKIQLN